MTITHRLDPATLALLERHVAIGERWLAIEEGREQLEIDQLAKKVRAEVARLQESGLKLQNAVQAKP